MEDTNIETKPNDVKSTSVSITLNAKSLGVDAFIKLEQTCEFANPVTEVDALVKREEIAQLLTEQALNIVSDAAKTVKQFIAERGLTAQPVNALPRPVVTGTGADSIRAVANGATGDSDWRVAVDSFDSAKQVRYLSTQTLTSEQLKVLAHTWLANQGFTNDVFDIWDERKDAEAGKTISSICNIKVKEAYRGGIKPTLIFTDKGGVKAIVRAKFNADGSVYFYWANKEVSTAVEFGAFDSLKG